MHKFITHLPEQTRGSKWDIHLPPAFMRRFCILRFRSSGTVEEIAACFPIFGTVEQLTACFPFFITVEQITALARQNKEKTINADKR